GLPAVRVSHDDALRIQKLVESDPTLELSVDLEALTVMAGRQKVTFTMPDPDRRSLVSGTWDSTAMLLANKDQIVAASKRIPYLHGFAESKTAS
ncbi:MAG TPA: isopropylmalate isomerase, partial [Spirochaetia bacterium]|nr:isopropylmalate isomerase [Spirochaetia bacterium]